MAWTDIPSHAQWLELTKLTLKPRSPELKALDAAIQAWGVQASMAKLVAVREALDAWCQKEQKSRKKPILGMDWIKDSERNKNLAFSNLYDLVNPSLGKPLDQDSLDALKIIEEAQANAIRNIFVTERKKARKLVEFKAISAVQAAAKAAKELKNAITGAGNVKSTAKAGAKSVGSKGLSALPSVGEAGIAVASFASALKDCITNAGGSTVSPDDVFKYLGQGTLGNFVANCIPVLGVLTSGAKSIKSSVQAIYGVYEATQIKKKEGYLRPGDPQAALKAIMELMDREIAAHLQSAALNGASCLAKLGGFFADLGTGTTAAIGMLQSFAELLILIFNIARDFKERNLANELFLAATREKNPEKLDCGLFEKCPIVAAYYLMVAGDSTVLNMALANYGKPGWMFQVEVLKKQSGPIFEKAAELIDSSRLAVVGLEKHRLLYEKTKLTTVKELGTRFIRWISRGKLLKRKEMDHLENEFYSEISEPTLVSTTNTQATIPLSEAQKRFGGKK